MTTQLLLSTATLLLTLDLIGTFVFALSGAASGVKHKLDAFGVGVLAFVAGNAGGVTRDLLIGSGAAGGDQRLALCRRVAGSRRRDVRVASEPHTAAADRAAVG